MPTEAAKVLCVIKTPTHDQQQQHADQAPMAVELWHASGVLPYLPVSRVQRWNVCTH